MGGVTAAEFVARLERYRSTEKLENYQQVLKHDEGSGDNADQFMGVRMGQVFGLAKESVDMAPEEIEKLLDSPIHEVRVGALSIMDKQARLKKTPEGRRKELFDLYLRRHDRINNWDLVDVAAVHVVGRYLFDKPRDVLYELARSRDTWERRTAIVSTLYFVRKDDLDDTFKLAGILVDDEHDLINKAVGGLLRDAGKHDRPRLLSFLDQHAATMPRVTLRYAIEHLDPQLRQHYLGLKKRAAG